MTGVQTCALPILGAVAVGGVSFGAVAVGAYAFGAVAIGFVKVFGEVIHLFNLKSAYVLF